MLNATTLAIAVTSHNFNIVNIETGLLAFSVVHFDISSEELRNLSEEEGTSPSSYRRSEASYQEQFVFLRAVE